MWWRNCDDVLSRFDFRTIPGGNGQTDGRTDEQTETEFLYCASALLCWRAIKNEILEEYLALASIAAGLSHDINISTVKYRITHVSHTSFAVNKRRRATHQWILFMTESGDVMLKNTKNATYLALREPSLRATSLWHTILESSRRADVEC